MKRLDDETLDALARLARIELDPVEREGLRRDLERVLGYVASLAELDTGEAGGMSRPQGRENVLREDEVRESLPAEVALALAPESEEGYFRVPRMIDEGE